MIRDMTLPPDSDRYPLDAGVQPDVTASPGWEAIDDELKARCLNAASQYVIQVKPGSEEWMEKQVVDPPTFAGYRALRLLQKEAPDLLKRLPDSAWKNWAPVVIAYPESVGVVGQEPMLQLVAEAYRHAPDEIIRTLNAVMSRENEEHGHIFVIGKLELCLDEPLVRGLLERAMTDSTLKAGSLGDILGEVLPRVDQATVQVARCLVKMPAPAVGEAREKARVAAAATLARGGQTGFDSLWADLQNDPDFCAEVLTEIAKLNDQLHAAMIADSLREESIAELYIFTARQFPPERDPRREGAHWVTDQESVYCFRDALLERLCAKGTPASYQAVQRIAEVLPYDWLKHVVHRARAIALSRTWEGCPPGVLLKMVRQRDSRLVESGEQLLDAVMASLKKLQADLRAEVPAVRHLWNDDDTPKHEEALSDEVCQHLKRDLEGTGVVANREVQVNKRRRTDIHVDAIQRDPRTDELDTVTLIIEVKGCWHDELCDAMRTQLRDGYLKQNNCPYGIYLVGWFMCPKWRDDDLNKTKTRRQNLEDPRGFFDRQAEALSVNGYILRAVVLDTSWC